MKKNKFLRLASVMLMLCLITTCAISGTFAKYTTSDTGSDSARVAKWGVTVELSGASLFSDTYNSNKVVGTSSAKVVAPGTSGTLAGITISGQPEVATTVSVSGSITFTGWTVSGAEYCPIVVTVDGVNYQVGTGIDTSTDKYFADIDALEAALVTAIGDLSTSFNAGDTLNGTGINSMISWSWGDEVDNTKDTVLGDLAADGNISNDPTIELSITISVDQTL